MTMAHQTDTSIPTKTLALSEDNQDKLSKLWKRKKLSKIYNAVAAVAMGGLAIALATTPETFINTLQAASSVPEENWTQNANLGQTLGTIGLWGFMVGLITTQMMGNVVRKTRDIANEFNTSMHDRYKAQQTELLRAEQENFITDLNSRADDPTTITAEDLEVLSLCDKDLQAMVSTKIPHSMVIKNDLSDSGSFEGTTAEDRATLLDQNRITIDDKTNTMWFLPAMLTFTSPALLWWSDKTLNAPETEKDARLPAPEKPNLYYLANRIKQGSSPRM